MNRWGYIINCCIKEDVRGFGTVFASVVFRHDAIIKLKAFNVFVLAERVMVSTFNGAMMVEDGIELEMDMASFAFNQITYV